MTVLICGSRTWTEREPIRRELAKLPAGTVIVHGAARGADSIAGEEAKALGLQVRAFPADWDTHGKAAGPIRNAQMLREGAPDLVLAFTHDLETSRGTRHMVTIARQAGVEVRVIDE